VPDRKVPELLNGQARLPEAPATGDDDRLVSAKDFLDRFGEELHRVLDVGQWHVGSDISHEYTRIAEEVRQAVEWETSLQQKIRADVFPLLEIGENIPKNAGVHQADMSEIERLHQGLLFNGGVEACSGSLQVHETLPLTIYQIGVALASYQGNQGALCQRLYRRDLRQRSTDTVDEVIEVLKRRALGGNAQGGPSEPLGELAQKAILDYAERAILLHRSTASWRMGHGDPVTYELLTGGNNLDVMVAGTNVVRELVEKHKRFVFVAQEPRDRMLLTVAQALRPMEFAIVSTLDERLERWIHQRRFEVGVSARFSWDGELIPASKWIPRFIRDVASHVVVGLFRATPVAPAHLFFAHEDYSDIAAHLVLADSILQEHRGSPLLCDVARNVHKSIFGETLEALAEMAYAAAGAPWRYSLNRSTRR
jgi:hypothetical protein